MESIVTAHDREQLAWVEVAVTVQVRKACPGPSRNVTSLVFVRANGNHILMRDGMV